MSSNFAKDRGMTELEHTHTIYAYSHISQIIYHRLYTVYMFLQIISYRKVLFCDYTNLNMRLICSFIFICFSSLFALQFSEVWFWSSTVASTSPGPRRTSILTHPAASTKTGWNHVWRPGWWLPRQDLIGNLTAIQPTQESQRWHTQYCNVRVRILTTKNCGCFSPRSLLLVSASSILS